MSDKAKAVYEQIVNAPLGRVFFVKNNPIVKTTMRDFTVNEFTPLDGIYTRNGSKAIGIAPIKTVDHVGLWDHLKSIYPE